MHERLSVSDCVAVCVCVCVFVCVFCVCVHVCGVGSGENLYNESFP